MQPPAIGPLPARVLFLCEAGFCVRRVLVYLADGFLLSGYSSWNFLCLSSRLFISASTHLDAPGHRALTKT
ncbi:hypothetical protein SRM_p61012 (plasmid) [Salinibacter ruber M8]|uniref:Uncharacterized protein n=1 Tax=Salinibacter ruber (strain M8) TaxID=761659 RepID=D5H4C8_SALRM|nr:hypothetical protein SRM_p61012 [Salinibacter ruber M8]